MHALTNAYFFKSGLDYSVQTKGAKSHFAEGREWQQLQRVGGPDLLRNGVKGRVKSSVKTSKVSERQTVGSLLLTPTVQLYQGIGEGHECCWHPCLQVICGFNVSSSGIPGRDAELLLEA